MVTENTRIYIYISGNKNTTPPRQYSHRSVVVSVSPLIYQARAFIGGDKCQAPHATGTRVNLFIRRAQSVLCV